MNPVVLSGLVTGGASLLGNLFSSETSAANTQANIQAQEQMQQQTEQYNAQQAGINRQFQAQQVNQQDLVQQQNMAEQQGYETQMSNTAYQRAANDMKRAGLNPMMMFSSGSAASTPSVSAASGASAGGSSASVGTPNMALNNRVSALGNLGGALSSAFDAMNKYQNIQASDADIALQRSRKSLVDSQKFNVELQNQKLQGGPGAGPTEAGIADNELAKARATSAKNNALEAQHEYDARSTEAGKVADQSKVFIKPLGDAVGVASDIAAPFVSSAVRKQGMDMLREKMNRSQYRHTEQYDEYGNLTGSSRSESGLNP